MQIIKLPLTQTSLIIHDMLVSMNIWTLFHPSSYQPKHQGILESLEERNIKDNFCRPGRNWDRVCIPKVSRIIVATLHTNTKGFIMKGCSAFLAIQKNDIYSKAASWDPDMIIYLIYNISALVGTCTCVGHVYVLRKILQWSIFRHTPMATQTKPCKCFLLVSWLCEQRSPQCGAGQQKNHRQGHSASQCQGLDVTMAKKFHFD